MEDIRIYTVCDGSAVAKSQDRLAKIFAGRPPDDQITFSVSADGSRVWFEDTSILWSNTIPERLPQTAAAAELAARRFVGRINLAVQQDQGLATVGINRLFPDDIRSSLVATATDPDRGVVDHWLVRFDSYLPTDTSAGSAQVFGAIVEFRVGIDGNIGGCWLTWRPCYWQGSAPLIPVPKSIAMPADPSSAPAAPVLMYRLDDEGVFQSYIAPYFFVQQEDDGAFFPASVYSLAISIVADPTSAHVRLAAQVVGGSGQYDYRWASVDSTNIWAEISDLGTDDGIDLGPGVYDVLLRVTDRITQMVAFTARSIYTNMFAPSDVSSVA